MRLLNLNFEFSEHDDSPPPYAILSHTWSENNEEEVTFKDVKDGVAKSLLKLELCRDWAKDAGYEYFWIDTCCINKDSDAEIVYAIRSMWRWYKEASVCFVYLSDLSKKRERDGRGWREALKDCRWFTRGWTLQELVASKKVEFHARDGYLGSMDDLSQELRSITGIDLGVPFPSHAQRLKWVENRQTKRPEDKAYCMLGICEVILSPLYGEGGKSAWRRLQDAIMHRHGTIALETRSGTGEDHRQGIMRSLRFDTMETRRTTVKVALATTCKWVLNHPACARWLRMEHKFFWIKGKPGAGKSVLIKYMDQHVTRKIKKSSAIGLYFYFNARGEQLEKSFLGLYRSLLVQLVDAVPEMSEKLDRLATPFEVAHLQDGLASAMRDCGRQIWLFVDALDECLFDDVHDLITFFTELEDVELYVCFASRHYPIVYVPTKLQLVLEEVDQHSDDLAKYVEKLKLKLTGEELSEIQQEIVKKANGIFLWVVLVVNILEKEVRRGRFHAVQDRLREIPTDLPKLFKTIIHRDGEHIEEFLLCLYWILYAQRPLGLSEWYYAMMAGVGRSLEAQANMSDVRMEEFLLSSSKSLAELTKGKKTTVQFIHESVRDYLIKYNGLREICPDTGSLEGIAHDKLKSCCLRGLAFELPRYPKSDRQIKKLLTADQRQSLMARYLFAKYATIYILHHTDEAAAYCSQQQFLASSFSIPRWIIRFNAFQERLPNVYASIPSRTYICAERDLARLMIRPCNALAEEYQRYQIPLVASFVSSSWKAAKILLADMGVHDVEAVLLEAKSHRPYRWYISSSLSSCPRQWAIRNGLLHLSKHFLATADESELHDRDVSSYDLRLAIESGNLTLIEHVRTAFPTPPNGVLVGIAFTDAASKGQAEIVKLLLDTATRKSLIKALYCASEGGHTGIVRLLLNNGADINAEGGSYGNALQAASAEGSAEVVRLLLNNGAEVNTTGGRYGSALQVASSHGSAEIVRLLLNNDAEVNAQGGFYGNALQAASATGSAEIVRLLLDKGADTTAQGGYYGTALQAALANRRAMVVRLLLDNNSFKS